MLHNHSIKIKKVSNETDIKLLNVIIRKTHKSIFLQSIDRNTPYCLQHYKNFCKNMSFKKYDPKFSHFIFYKDSLSGQSIATVTLDTNKNLWLERDTDVSLKDIKLTASIAEIIRFGILPFYRRNPYLMTVMFFATLEQIVLKKINYIFVEAILGTNKMYEKIGFQYFIQNPVIKFSSKLPTYIMWISKERFIAFLTKHKHSSLGSDFNDMFNDIIEKANLS